MATEEMLSSGLPSGPPMFQARAGALISDGREKPGRTSLTISYHLHCMAQRLGHIVQHL